MQTTSAMKTNLLERSLAVLGAAVCLIVTIVIWLSVSAMQPMWPLPGAYFIEMALVSLLPALAILRGGRRTGLAAWIAAGILTAFSILAAFSVGPFYLPLAILFGALALYSDVTRRGPILAHLGLGALAAFAQVGLILALIRLR